MFTNPSSSRLHLLNTQLNKSLNPDTENQSLLLSNPTPFFSKLVLNRPTCLNALTKKMALDLTKICDDWNKSTTTKIVWFTGNGGKAFCAGGDIKTLYEAKFLKEKERHKIHDNFFRFLYICDYKLAFMRPIQISVLDGIVMGGGVGISIYSKIKIATEATIFAMPEAKIGLFTDISASYFLSRLPNNLGMFLALTGTRLRGAEMVQVGLANFFVRKANLDKLQRDLVENVSQDTCEEEIFAIVEKYSEKVSEEYVHSQKTKELFGGQSYAEIHENLKKDQKYREFSKNCLNSMELASPTSLRVIFEGLKKGKNLTLAEVFQMEFRLTQRFMNDKDFFEGVRCTLVDKKDKPKWKYENPLEMPEEEVAYYFCRVPERLELKLESAEFFDI